VLSNTNDAIIATEHTITYRSIFSLVLEIRTSVFGISHLNVTKYLLIYLTILNDKITKRNKQSSVIFCINH